MYEDWIFGIQRARGLNETIAAIRPIASDIGITRLANLTGLDRAGVSVISTVRPTSYSNCIAFGKGLSEQSALVSGIMETIENHFAESAYLQIPLASLKTRKIEGIDLSTSRPVEVDLNDIHTVFSPEAVSSSSKPVIGTNGLASGNCFTEAAMHGFWELIERESINYWIVRGEDYRRGTMIDPGSAESAGLKALMSKLKASDFSVYLFDITSDLRIPVVMAFLVDNTIDGFQALSVTSSTACNSSAEFAALRALLGAAQTRLTLISGARDDIPWSSYAKSELRKRWIETLANAVPYRRFEQLPGFCTKTMDDCLQTTIDRFLSSAGRKPQNSAIHAVELTPAGYPVSVVKLIIPSIEQPYFNSAKKIGWSIAGRLRESV